MLHEAETIVNEKSNKATVKYHTAKRYNNNIIHCYELVLVTRDLRYGIIRMTPELLVKLCAAMVTV